MVGAGSTVPLADNNNLKLAKEIFCIVLQSKTENSIQQTLLKWVKTLKAKWWAYEGKREEGSHSHTNNEFRKTV